MARTILSPNEADSPNPTTGVVATMTAADVVNGNRSLLMGKEMLIAHNSGASSRTVSVISAPDDLGRTGDITSQAIAAGAIRLFGPFQVKGWRQDDGYLYFEANHADVKFGVIQIP